MMSFGLVIGLAGKVRNKSSNYDGEKVVLGYNKEEGKTGIVVGCFIAWEGSIIGWFFLLYFYGCNEK